MIRLDGPGLETPTIEIDVDDKHIYVYIRRFMRYYRYGPIVGEQVKPIVGDPTADSIDWWVKPELASIKPSMIFDREDKDIVSKILSSMREYYHPTKFEIYEDRLSLDIDLVIEQYDDSVYFRKRMAVKAKPYPKDVFYSEPNKLCERCGEPNFEWFTFCWQCGYSNFSEELDD